MKRKFYYHIAALLALSSVVILCFCANMIHLNIRSQEDTHISERYIDKYGIQGLPIGTELQEKPDFIDDDYIYFSDRILKIFKNNKEANTYTAEVINNLMNSIPDTISKYIILLPSRITYEENALKYSDNCLDSINEIYQQITQSALPIDVDPILKKHAEEYIYLRTDSDITSLGAYYISKAFCENKGLNAVDINTYYEYRFEGFTGVYTSLENSRISEQAYDYVSYYLKNTASNWQTVTVRRKAGSYETIESPAIALSRRGMNVFVAGEYSQSILDGDRNNGKTLLLVGDSSANKLAVWLTPYYENVFLVGSKRYQGGKEGFEQIFQNYNITDVILMEEADSFGQTVYNGKIVEFTP